MAMLSPRTRKAGPAEHGKSEGDEETDQGLAWDKAKSRRKGRAAGHVATARGLKKNAYKTRAAAADQICLSISLHRLSLLLMPVSSPPPLFRFTFRQFAEPVVGLQVAPLPLLRSPPWPVIAGERGKDTELQMLVKKASRQHWPHSKEFAVCHGK